MQRLIIFLIRKRLGLRKLERFRFDNQKADAVYWFTEDGLLKCQNGYITMSGVSLNWLLNDDCTVTVVC